MKNLLSILVCLLALTKTSSGQNCANHYASSTNSIVNGQTAYFTNTSTDHAGQFKRAQYDFGDGVVWGSSFSPFPHTYVNPGTYTVKLKNTWYDSSTLMPVCVDSFFSTIIITAPNPCASHNASFTSSINGMTATFTNTSTNNPGQVKNESWDFGDGTSPNYYAPPPHTYANLGTYTVTHNINWIDSVTWAPICADSFVSTITIATTSNVISGYIIKDIYSAPTNPSYKVWLIQYNSVTNMLTAVDSFTTNTGGSWTYYEFNNKPAGDYLVKAAMQNQSSANGYIPTYYNSSLYWNQAAYIHHQNYNYGQNINMKTGVVTAGPGFIGGNVSQGANKGTNNGVEGQLVYLKDANNQVVKSTVTDNNGDFSFSNLPVGSYSLYPEEMNYVTTPITGISITASNTNATGYMFGKNGNEIKPKATSVSTVPTQNHVIFPNPANTKLYIRWAQTPQDVAITISDLAGHKVYQSATNPVSGSSTEVNIAQIPSGIYFLILENDGVKHTEKLVIQH